MSNKNFFDNQSDGTAVKIKFYENYIEGYLTKILMQFGGCLVADLFCGPGKNGEKDGSPLILIKKAKKVLENPTLLVKQKLLKVFIVFNDCDKENIEKLNIELSKTTLPSNIKILKPQCSIFSDIILDISEPKITIPKFLFLDPFAYSNIQLSEIKKIMEMPFSEIMLFLPTFHAYRFKTSTKNTPKLISFLSNFTERGVYDYHNIYEFNNSIVNRIRKELNLKFVQHATIDVGKSKNALFLITKSIKGAMLFNNIFWKETYNGKALKVSEIKYHEINPSLFPKSTILTTEHRNCINEFHKKMVVELIKKKEMFNTDIIEFAVMEGYKPKCANDMLVRLKKENKIKTEYINKIMTKGFYVSEDKYKQKLCKIIYL